MVGCQVLRATAHGGLGNQLLYLLSVAVLANFLSIPTCHLRLASFRYGSRIYNDFEHALPGLARAVEPCVILAPDSPWTHDNITNAEVAYRYKRSAKKVNSASNDLFELKRSTIHAACVRAVDASKNKGLTQSALRLDHYYNFCGAAGLVKAFNMPASVYWENMVARANTALRSKPAPRGEPFLNVNESTLCVHIRARTVEPIVFQNSSRTDGRSMQKPTETRCAHAFSGRWKRDSFLGGLYERMLKAQGRRRGVCKGIQTPLEPVEKTLNRAAAALHAHRINGSLTPNFQSLFVASPIPVEIPRSLAALDRVEVRAFHERADDFGGWTSAKAAIADLKALSSCSTVVLEDGPLVSTFAQVAMLAANLTQCGPPFVESEKAELAPGGSTGALVLVQGGTSLTEACARVGHLPPLKSQCPSRGGERKSDQLRPKANSAWTEMSKYFRHATQ